MKKCKENECMCVCVGVCVVISKIFVRKILEVFQTQSNNINCDEITIVNVCVIYKYIVGHFIHFI